MIYTRANLRSAINRRLHNKLGVLADPDASINDAVREVTSIMDLRSMIRSAALSPVLLSTNYIYVWPSDVKGYKIIDIQPIGTGVVRDYDDDWSLVHSSDFDQWKSNAYNLISFADTDTGRTLLVSTSTLADGTVAHNLLYYSRYPWLDADGVTRKPNSTKDSDYIMAEDDEYNLFFEKAIELTAPEAREPDDANRAMNKFGMLKKEYQKYNKSQALHFVDSYYDLGF